MVATIIVLILVIAALVALMIFKKEWVMQMFGNSITAKVERKKKLEGEVEVLKKEQKVEIEETVKNFEVRKTSELDAMNAQINNFKAQIKNLEKAKQDRADMLTEELKVAVDKVTNNYNRKIISKQNQAKKLGYYIDAEQKNIEDVIDPAQPNAPTEKKTVMGFGPLVEDKPNTTKKKSK